MGKIIQLNAGKDKDKSVIFVETADVSEKRIVEAGGIDVEKNFNKMLERLKPFCESIINNFQSLSKSPNSASAEFGVSIAGEGNLFVVKASGEATIKITLNWETK